MTAKKRLLPPPSAVVAASDPASCLPRALRGIFQPQRALLAWKLLLLDSTNLRRRCKEGARNVKGHCW
jgi:hypothetical protein